MAIKRLAIILGAAAFACGCASFSSSVLISRKDETFSEAQKHLERTSALVERSSASPAERALFLQAESFYRYRFEPPPRSAASYAAEAAAAITDFPAFQSLAGSMDLLDSRLKAPDSAVQLWESLLEDYPGSSLRSLTLYRLGWAYRSAGIAGLPCKSPDEAFSELIKEDPKSSLAPLAHDAESVPWKSKNLAATRSLIPGLGQLYVGETQSGVVRLAVASAAAAAVAIPAYVAERRGKDLQWNRDWRLLAIGVGGLVVLSFDFTNSYEDAMRGVIQWNERSETAFERQHPGAP